MSIKNSSKIVLLFVTVFKIIPQLIAINQLWSWITVAILLIIDSLSLHSIYQEFQEYLIFKRVLSTSIAKSAVVALMKSNVAKKDAENLVWTLCLHTPILEAEVMLKTIASQEQATMIEMILQLTDSLLVFEQEPEQPETGISNTDPTCFYFADSPYIRCAVEPKRSTCQGCPKYRYVPD